MLTTRLKVRHYGDPILRQKAKVVKSVGPAERMLVASMLETMYVHKGIGLAAVQVGVSEQILVADTGDGTGPIIVFNPEILKEVGSEVKEEGCLSIPDVSIKVKRALTIRLRYRNIDNKVVEADFSGMWARVILHETDHLMGRLIIDYASPVKKIKIKKQLDAIVAGKISVNVS